MSPLVLAEQIEGHLHRSNNELSIHLNKDNKTYRLASLTTDVKDVVARLENYDFVRGQGEIRNDQILLETIDFIGLRQLIGGWSLDGGSFLTFKDFLNATYSVPDFIFSKEVEQYTYSLAPGESKSWRILVSNGQWVSVGYLDLKKDRLKIQFIDIKTGQLKKPIELTRKYSTPL